MKTILNIFALIFLTATMCLGQKNKVPKNLKQAVVYLNQDCPDSVKNIIKRTKDNNLIDICCYPEHGEYKTIFNWTNRENNDSKIVKYLDSKGVSFHKTDVLLIAFKYFLLGQKIDEDSIYMQFQKIEIKWANEDKIRFTTDSLRGIYIPKDLDDCFKQIESFWADSTKAKMKLLSENDFRARLHLGFGTWIRNNWGLWGGSRLSKYFNDMGIFNPEDMSGIILTSYHRTLNGKEIKINEQIKSDQDYWEKSKIEEKEQANEELSKYKMGDTVIYQYGMSYVNKRQEDKFKNSVCTATGIVTDIDTAKFSIKVRLIESCDKKGIIYYNSKYYKTYNADAQKWETPKKRIIKRLKKGKEKWFVYSTWELY